MRTTLLHLFTPHHTNNFRARILHPAGLSVLVAIFVLTQTWTNLLNYAPALPGGFVLGYASNITIGQTIESTNSERSKQGLPPLRVNTALSQAAVAKANHMFQHDYWAHIAPDGTTPWVFIKNAGYSYAVAGENLARDFDSTGSMMSAWMASPTHRDNIVNSKYTEIGIGVVNGTLAGVETTLVVQMFGKPSSAAAQTTTTAVADTSGSDTPPPTSLPTTNPTPESSPEPTGITVAAIQPAQPMPPQTELAQAQAAALGTSLSAPGPEQFSNVLVSPLLITKSVSTSIILMMLAVLIYDLAYIKHKKIPRKVGKNWAHLTLLAFTLIFIAMVTGGKIL